MHSFSFRDFLIPKIPTLQFCYLEHRYLFTHEGVNYGFLSLEFNSGQTKCLLDKIH